MDVGDVDMLGLDVEAKLEDPSGVPLKVSDTELDGEGELEAVREYSGDEELDTEGLPEGLLCVEAVTQSVPEIVGDNELLLDEDGEDDPLLLRLTDPVMQLEDV